MQSVEIGKEWMSFQRNVHFIKLFFAIKFFLQHFWRVVNILYERVGQSKCLWVDKVFRIIFVMVILSRKFNFKSNLDRKNIYYDSKRTLPTVRILRLLFSNQNYYFKMDFLPPHISCVLPELHRRILQFESLVFSWWHSGYPSQ